MDNISLARALDETAALLEIDGGDSFRIRSYRRAAEAVEQQTTQLATLATAEADPKALLAIPGIGKGMAANIRDLVATGSMPLREELLKKYKPSMLELLRRLQTSMNSKLLPNAATFCLCRALGKNLRTSSSKASRTIARTPRASASTLRASTPSASPNSFVNSPASTRSLPPAACAVAARPAAISISSSPAQLVNPML